MLVLAPMDRYMIVYKQATSPEDQSCLFRTYFEAASDARIIKSIAAKWEEMESKRSAYYGCAYRAVEIESVWLTKAGADDSSSVLTANVIFNP
jgi:hypothetical protein